MCSLDGPTTSGEFGDLGAFSNTLNDGEADLGSDVGIDTDDVSGCPCENRSIRFADSQTGFCYGAFSPDEIVCSNDDFVEVSRGLEALVNWL